MSEKSGSDPADEVPAPCRAVPGFAFFLKKKKKHSTTKPKIPLINSHFNEGRFLGSNQYMFVSYCKQALVQKSKKNKQK